MKFKLTLFALLFAGLAHADTMVSFNTLPQNARDFIQTHFKGSQVNLVTQDTDSFDVLLGDGVKIEFFINGDWKEVDGKYKAIPTEFLPPKVVENAKSAQPNAQIVEVDKKPYGIKLKFSNQMEVYTDASGSVIGQKFDN